MTRSRRAQTPSSQTHQSLTPQQIDVLARKEQSELNPTRYRKPVEEWDLEELARGRPRAADGSFKGRNPKWVSSEVLEESRKRFQQGSLTAIEASFDSAIKVITHILKDSDNEPRVRLDAAKFIVNHVMGTPRVRAEIVTNSPFQSILAASLVNPDGASSHPLQIQSSSPSQEQDPDIIDIDSDDIEEL